MPTPYLKKTLFLTSIASAIALSSSVLAEPYYYVVNKATDLKLHACSTENEAVRAIANDDESTCSQWEKVDIGDNFHLINRETGKTIRPKKNDDTSNIVTRDPSATGSATQWSFEEREQGYGHIVNKKTGNYFYVPKQGIGSKIKQRPATKTGDSTQWIFEEVVDTPEVIITTLEAEDGLLQGNNARVYPDPIASAGQGVAFITSTNDGFSFQGVPASKSLSLAYASTFTGSISVSINGQFSDKINFSSTGGWENHYEFAGINLDIPEAADIAIYYSNGDQPLNIDYVSFSTGDFEIPEPPPKPSISGKYSPEDETVLVFVGQDNETVGGNATYRDGYVDHIGVPAGITSYIDFREQIIDLTEVRDNPTAGPKNLKFYVDSDVLEGTVQHLAIDLVGFAGRVANGEKDDLIAELAQFLNDYPQYPFIIRIGYEFDGGHNGYNATEWRGAYIRIVDGLREAGVTNFSTMMHSLTMDTSFSTWDAFYPGDEYVDWIGYSYWGGARTDNAATLAYARNHGKPVCICEMTPRTHDMENGDGQAIWDSWFVPLFIHLEAHKDIIKAVSYINTDWPSQPQWINEGFFNTTDARMQTNPVVTEKWLEKMSEEKYIHSPENVFEIIKFEPAQ